MHFRITGLTAEPFQHLFGLPEDELARHGAHRYIADQPNAFPDRIELRDASPGETLLLVNHCHQPADTPYRATHAVFVREGATKTFEAIDDVPDMLRRRLLSLRAFSCEGMLIGADVTPGTEIEPLIDRLFQDPAVDYIHVHNAREGCYHARVDRA